MHLLHVALSILLHVLGETVLDALLELLDDVTTCVADAHLGLLALLAALLCKLLTALLRQRGNAQADNLAIVLGRDAHVAVHDGLLDGTEHALVPRLDGDGARVGSIDCCHLVQGHQTTVTIYANAIQDLHVGLACTDVCQSLLKIHYSFFHFLLGLAKGFFYINHILLRFMVYNSSFYVIL